MQTKAGIWEDAAYIFVVCFFCFYFCFCFRHWEIWTVSSSSVQVYTRVSLGKAKRSHCKIQIRFMFA